MTTVEKIKAKILDLAIRGKLVSQNPDDEPASVLLGRIKAEKAKLVKAGKIKKDKNPSEIVVGSDGATYEKFADSQAKDISDDLPFDLPQGWVWCHIKEVTLLKRGEYVTREQIQDGKIPVILGGQEPAYYCNKHNHDGPCVVISRSGASAGFASYWESPIFVTDGFLFECVDGLSTKFFFYWYKSFPLVKQRRGTGMPHVQSQILNGLLFPLPPNAEQERIVSKIEALFAYAEKIGKASDGISQVAQRLDKKILDLAIRGQLVPQDPNDEPASELIKRIEAAKKATAKGRKSSRIAASDRPAYETEAPFDIPDSWEWVQLGSISNYGECKSVDAHDVAADTWSLDLEEIEKGTGRLLCRKYAGEKTSTSSKHVFSKGMILYSKLRTYLNKVLVADREGVCTSEIIPIALYDNITPEYVRLVLMSPYFLAYTASKDYGVKMPRIGTSDARAALIPLPPINEQGRIVAKVEELKAMISNLVNS